MRKSSKSRLTNIQYAQRAELLVQQYRAAIENAIVAIEKWDKERHGLITDVSDTLKKVLKEIVSEQ